MATNTKMEDIQEIDNRMIRIQNFLKCQVWRSFAHYLDVKNVLVDMSNVARSFC